MKNKNSFTLEGLRHLIKEAVVATYQPESHSYLLEQPELLDEIITKAKYPFKAIYIFGPAGSGKGHIRKKELKIPARPKKNPGDRAKDFYISNPDDFIEEVFPAFGMSMVFANSEEGDDARVEELQQISRKILQQHSRDETADHLARGNPILWDTTGERVGDQVVKIEALSRLGYDIGVMLVNVPTEASVERDIERGKDDPETGEPGRSVGPKRTTEISKEFQAQVVRNNGYYKQLKSIPHVTMFTDRVFNNIFDLKTKKLLQIPTPVDPNTLPKHLDPRQNPDAPDKEIEQMALAKDAVEKFLAAPVTNPNGKLLMEGMVALIKHPGPPKGHPDHRSYERVATDQFGRFGHEPETKESKKGYSPGSLGQNMNDLPIAMAKGYFQDDAIVAAAEHLSKVGKGPAAKRKAEGGPEPDPKKSSEADAAQDILRGKKTPLDPDTGEKATMAGIATQYHTRKAERDAGDPIKQGQSESVDYDDLVDMIREVITNKP